MSKLVAQQNNVHILWCFCSYREIMIRLFQYPPDSVAGLTCVGLMPAPWKWYISHRCTLHFFRRFVLLWLYPVQPTLITRFMGPTWGPPGADKTQLGPMLAPWISLSGYLSSRASIHKAVRHSKNLVKTRNSIMIVSRWNLTGIPTALLLRYLSNIRAIGKSKPESFGFET